MTAEVLQYLAPAVAVGVFCAGAALRGLGAGLVFAGVAASLLWWIPAETTALIAQALSILVIAGVLVYLT